MGNLHCKGGIAQGFLCSEAGSSGCNAMNKKDFIEESLFGLLIQGKPRVEPCYGDWHS